MSEYYPTDNTDFNNPGADLLYFLLPGDRILNLYKILLQENEIDMPASTYDEYSAMPMYDFHHIEKLVKRKNYKTVFIMDIEVKEGKVTEFFNNVDVDENVSENVTINSFDYGSKLDLINKTLKLNSNVNANVRCKLFNIDNDYMVYNNILENDPGNIKYIFVSDDTFGNENTKKFLVKILEDTHNKTQTYPNVVLLPCLHRHSTTGTAINDGVGGLFTSENQCKDITKCQKIELNNEDGSSKKVITDIYTDFYKGVRGGNSFKKRSHCRDTTFISIVLNNFYTDNINRIEGGGKRRKSYKKSRKTSKKSKKTKTKKHKKTRK
jgi:hypothetical protein